ncbi:hypothetical protein PVA8_358 [Vibrio phage PVA8]|nr:hypothetical protein [Vibrio phage PC-Liy1]URQ03344.1 hypothetical protein PVA8_358 [Vibrio phage PVA8]WBM59077.1 hypothetical protein vBValMPVA8_355 [Vibrio phage vB_ValM_PVA8]
MTLIEVITFMRENESLRQLYEDPETGVLHTIVRKDDGFYVNDSKICDL